MEPLTSIWDGWEKQFFGTVHTNKEPLNDEFFSDGYRCAVLYPRNCFSAESQATFARVAPYIVKHYGEPEECGLNPLAVVMWANNHLRLTPDQFREIDRLTQIAEGLAAIESATPVAEVREEVQHALCTK